MTRVPSKSGLTPGLYARGATLIELVIVMSLIAIIAAIASIAIREPLQSYADTSRRAELTDLADTAVRRLGRDLHLALPNSTRVKSVGTTKYLEFLPIRTGGRYRANEMVGVTQANFLDFSGADDAFNMLGAPSAVVGQAIVLGDIVVVRNESATLARSNAYTFNHSGSDASGTTYDCTSATGANCNTSQVTAAPVDAGGPATVAGKEFKITIDSRLFNASSGRGIPSPGNRFYVITNSPVSFVCTPNAVLDGNGDATGTLTRVTGYAIQFGQPTAFAGATSSVLANNIAECDLDYDDLALGRNGLVAIRLKLTRGNESVSLYYEAHVNNAP
jgi:MSHA biogenesis protein MshO